MIDDNLMSIIKNRRSIRKFDLNKKVEYQKIEQLIEAANYAPSACNAQGWHFIVLDDVNIIEQLANEGIHKVKKTPLIILVYYRKYIKGKPLNMELDDHIQSASAAIQNLLLTAYNIGLGGVWINGIDTNAIDKVINRPDGYEFIAMLRVGYPISTNIKLQSRKFKLDEIISYNNINLPIHDLENNYNVKKDKFKSFLKKYSFFKRISKIVPTFIKNLISNKKDIDSFKVN